MQTSEASSNKPAVQFNVIAAFFPLLGATGFFDATYLAVKHFLGTPIPCSLLKGCEVVTTSQYSYLFGIPVALLGSIYYLTILVLATIYFDTRRSKILKLLAGLTPVGFLASLWFVYLQIFVIKAICLYCMTSAATSTALFVIGMIYLFISRRCKKTDS